MNKKWKNLGFGTEFGGLYQSWCSIFERIRNTDRNPTYSDVTVCKRWLSYDNFFEDMSDTWFEGATLDKDSIKPGNRVYCKEYCKWMTRSENLQEMNKRRGGTMKGKFGGEHPKSKAIRCIETGEVFNSVREASKAKNWDESTLSKVCNGTRKSIYKTHWEYC